MGGMLKDAAKAKLPLTVIRGYSHDESDFLIFWRWGVGQMAPVGTSRVGKRGTIVLPANLRRRFGLDEGALVIAEANENGGLGGTRRYSPPSAPRPERPLLPAHAEGLGTSAQNPSRP
jgi:bifunctional DNA-binding transcriptional regulator/antitoxin component of YhaV-PrlF toxin-antitoxin module